MFYADDSQLYAHLYSSSSDSTAWAIQNVESCCKEVKEWMCSNLLKLNEEKTEVIVFGSRQRLKNVDINSISVAGCEVQTVTSVGNIGVQLDSNMTMEHQVNKIVSTSWYHLRNIFQIRKYLTQSATECIVHAFISSRLDLNNAILFGLPSKLIQKLQTIQNAAARIVVQASKFTSAKPILEKLHWLPVDKRIEYKIILLAFKAIHGLTASYLMDLLEIKVPNRDLRHNKGLLLVENNSKTTFNDRAFSTSAPKLWNQLPREIRDIKTIETFKKELKTFLFKSCY